MDNSGFDLDLKAVEAQMETDGYERVVVGVLDGSTPAEEWIETVEAGAVLVLSVSGDVNELGGDVADVVRELGGDMVSFGNSLVATPPGVTIDTDRL